MSLLLALTGSGGGGNAQSIAFTLDGIAVSVNQTDGHLQTAAFTLGDIASNSTQVANHPQALAITLDSVQVASNQSIGSAPKTQTVSIGLDSVGVSAQQIGPPDRMIQVIVGNQQRMRKTYEEEKRKTEEFLTITEVAKPRKAGTITLSQLVGKKAANQINQLDIEERIQKIARDKRRQQDDEFIMMM